MSTKYTRGPWRIHDTLVILAWNNEAEEYIAVATVGTADTTNEEDILNARIIAAAPEMLETIETTVDKLMVAYAVTKQLEADAHPAGAYLNEVVMRLVEDLKKVTEKAKGA